MVTVRFEWSLPTWLSVTVGGRGTEPKEIKARSHDVFKDVIPRFLHSCFYEAPGCQVSALGKNCPLMNSKRQESLGDHPQKWPTTLSIQ